ncbi:MAG TPA: hypothetical protein VFI25_07365 [Planctomycetota bacterium]|nr:hypothetical protein [Planctomycetota bacterium]
MLLGLILRGAILPALVTGFLLSALWRPWRKGAFPSRWSWIEPLAFAAGYASAQVALIGWPAFPPRESTHGLFYLAVAAGTLAPLASSRAIPVAARWIVSAVLAFAVPLLLLRARIEHRWSAGESAGWVFALGTAALAVGAASKTASRLPGPASILALLVPLTATAGVLVLSGTALHSQLAGAVAASLGAALALSVRRPGIALSPASTQFVSTLLCSFLVTGHFSTGVSAINVFLLGLCPITTFLTVRTGWARNLPTWRAAFVQLAASGLPATVSLGLALRAFLASGEPGY